MLAPKVAKASTKQRTKSVTENKAGGHNERGAEPASLTARGAGPGVSWDFRKISIFPPDRAAPAPARSPMTLAQQPGARKPRFPVGQFGDPLEHAADEIADQQSRASAPPIPAIVRNVLHNSGRALDADTKTLMGARFGQDFSAVRVHTNAQAAEAARALKASAFTVDSNIVFADGAYEPGTPRGQRLIAHELVHVLQHESFPGRASLRLSSYSSDAAERQADIKVQSLAMGLPLGVWSPEAPSSLLSLAGEKDPVVTGTGLVKAMTPEDMYNKLIALRGFEESIPASKLDEVKTQLTQMEADLKSNPTPALQRQYNKLLTQYNISTLEEQWRYHGAGLQHIRHCPSC